MAFDRFNDKPARREKRFSDRGSRPDRFGDRSSDRGDNGFRNREGGRFSERSRDDRPRFGSSRGRRDAGNFDFAKRSGPRAKAFEVRKFSDRNAFVQTATVRLEADVAEFFKTPEAVNAALRQVIALADLIRPAHKEEVQQKNENDEAAPKAGQAEVLTAASTDEDDE